MEAMPVEGDEIAVMFIRTPYEIGVGRSAGKSASAYPWTIGQGVRAAECHANTA